MTDIAPQQIALQNVTATTIRIGSIVQTINTVQRSQALSTIVNDRLPPVPDGDVWQVRNEERELGRLLTGTQCRLVGLYGAGGYGKSSTAAQVFKTVQGFGRKFWVNFQDPVNFGTFGRWMIRQFLGNDRYEQTRELYERCDDAELVNEVLSQLLAQNCLLVLDNLETLFQDEASWNAYGEFLNGWLMGTGDGCLVLTSQFRLDLPMAKVWEWIGLRGLEVAQGVAFLRAEQIVGQVEHLEAFVREADGHPLLLTLAVNLLKRREKDDFESPEILRLGQGDVEMLREIREAHRGDSEASVGKVLDLSFERLYPEWLRVLLWRSSVLRGQFGLAVVQVMMPDESVTLPEMRKLARWSFLLEQRSGDEWQFDILPLIRRYLKLGAKNSGNLHFAHEAAIEYFEANIKPVSAEMVLEDYREELEIFHHVCEIGNYRKAYSIYSTIDDFLSKRGFWTEQVRLLETLIVQWERTNDNRWEIGNCYLSLGSAYNSLGQYQHAIDLYQQSIEIKCEIRDRKGEAKSLDGLGSAYNSLGQYQHAIDLHQQSIEIQRKIRDRQGEANSLGNLGNVYNSLGQYQHAIELYQQCLEIVCEIGNRQDEATSLGNLGAAYNSLGQYQRAIEFHQQHNEIACEIGDRQGEATALRNLGNAYNSLGQYQRAIAFYQQSIDISREIGDRQGEAKSLWNLCSIYQQRGRLNLSMRYRNQAYRIWQDMRLPLAITPLPEPSKKIASSLGDNWAEQMIADEKEIAWLILSMGYLSFSFRLLLSPFTQLQRRLNIPSRYFWLFCVGVVICFVVWKLKN